MSKTNDLVLVEWQDSCSPSRKWQDRDEADKFQTAKCRSVGWLLRHDKQSLVLAASEGGDEIGDLTAIPTSCVLDVKKLVPSRSKRKS